MHRSPEFEREFRATAARQAGYAGDEQFMDAVADRMAKGAAEYELDQPALERPLFALIAEVAEEATDISGWICLAAQKLNAETDRREPATEELREKLVEIAAKGHALWRDCRDAAELERVSRGQ